MSVREYLSRLGAFGFTGAVSVQRGGREEVYQGYGLADRATETAFSPRTLFNFASFSKPITATAAMRLVEQNRLSLSDTLGGAFPNTPADKAPITLAQLLSHSAGLARDSVRNRPLSGSDQTVEAVLATPLRSPPGQTMAYSNDGYRLVAAMIERVTQRPFREVVRELVFQPAGMRRAGFVGDAFPRADVAIGYNEWGSVGCFLDWRTDLARNGDGSGSVVGSLDDLRSFMSAYTRGVLVRHATIETMTAVQARNEEEAYGLGWFITETPDGAKVVLHGGDNPGYHPEVRWHPSRELIIALVTTQELYDESGSGLGVHKRMIASGIRRLSDGEQLPSPPPNANVVPPARATAIAGAYQFADGARLTIYNAGAATNLWIGADGQSAVDLFDSANPERRAEFPRKNEQSLALANAVVAQDAAALRNLLTPDVHFLVGGLIEDFASYRARYGAFASLDLLGTRSEITDSEDVRTILRVRFENGAYDLCFTWRGDALYETMTDTGTPHALMMPVAQVEDDYAAYDFIRRRAITFTLTGGALSIGGLIAQRTA